MAGPPVRSACTHTRILFLTMNHSLASSLERSVAITPISKYFARKDKFVLPVIHLCGDSSLSKWQINEVKNGVKQVLDTTSQHKFTSRAKYWTQTGNYTVTNGLTKVATLLLKLPCTHIPVHVCRPAMLHAKRFHHKFQQQYHQIITIANITFFPAIWCVINRALSYHRSGNFCRYNIFVRTRSDEN